MKLFTGLGKLIRLFVTLFVISQLLLFISEFSYKLSDLDDSDDEISKKVFIIDDSLSGKGQLYAWHDRHWKSYNGDEYATSLLMGENDNKESRTFRNNLIYTYDDLGQVYQSLEKHDRDALHKVIDKLDSIKRNSKLSYNGFAKVIMSMVQDIPYVLVHDYSCLEVSKYGSEFYKEWHKKGKPCLPNTKYGIQAPAEFIYDLKGDCDTRTMFVYSVFKHYKYDVAILNSDYYGHSIIGINIASHGDFLKYKGKRYYFWETTSKDWEVGVLPPDMPNPDKFYVAFEI